MQFPFTLHNLLWNEIAFSELPIIFFVTASFDERYSLKKLHVSLRLETFMFCGCQFLQLRFSK